MVIIRGEGDIAFGAGSDISEFQERRSGDSTARYNDAEATASAALQGIPHPTIAMIHVRAGLPPAFPLCPCCRACLRVCRLCFGSGASALVVPRVRSGLPLSSGSALSGLAR